MAELQQREHDYYHHLQHPTDTQTQTIFPARKGGPSGSQVLALATLVPFGTALLILAGLTLTGTVVGLAVTTPLFVIFSPVLLPAAFVIGLAVTGFLTSGAFGVTSLSSFAWMTNYLRRSRPPEQGKRGVEEVQRTKETGESAISKTQEEGQKAQSKTQEKDQEAQSVAQEEGQEPQIEAQEKDEKSLSEAQEEGQKPQSEAQEKEGKDQEENRTSS